MARKNPFKKQSIIDTAVNVGVGGAANVAIDYAVKSIDALASVDPRYVKAGKFVLGAVAGSMVRNKYLRAACDGVATVGVSELIASFMDEPAEAAETTSGFAAGAAVGRVRMGKKMYASRAKRVSGTSSLID